MDVDSLNLNGIHEDKPLMRVASTYAHVWFS